MKKELYRAVINKKNIVLIAFIIFMMFFSAYNDGWKTAIFAAGADDIADPADMEYYQHYFGNTYRVWKSSYSLIQVLIPLLLLIPYALTYTAEKESAYRYLLVSRKGNRRYLFNKVFSIVAAGVAVVGFAELLFYSGTYLFTMHDSTGEYVAGIVANESSLFYQDAGKYSLFVFGLRLVYYAAFLVLAVGITSFFKNRMVILLLPFLVSCILEMIMPPYMQPNVLLLPWISQNYSLCGYLATVALYCFIGIVCLFLSEQLFYKNGA